LSVQQVEHFPLLFDFTISIARFRLPWFSQRVCWKKNDVAKMRQAGTAPAAGRTICCLAGLWCAVMCKHCSAVNTTNTLLRANVCLVLQSDPCRICCAVCGCVWNLEFRSIRSIRRSGALRASLMRCGSCASNVTQTNVALRAL